MQLPAVLARYGREVEADLMSEYQVELGGLYTGRLTPRRCWLLIEQLPPGSRLARAMGGGGAWTTTDHLLAQLLTAIRSDLAGKRLDAPEPPEPGWLDKAREKNDSARRRAARILSM